MATRGWSRRSRRGTLAVTDAAHSHPCSAGRLRFGVLRQPTASHETLRSKDADENCPACSARHKVARGLGGAGELATRCVREDDVFLVTDLSEFGRCAALNSG